VILTFVLAIALPALFVLVASFFTRVAEVREALGEDVRAIDILRTTIALGLRHVRLTVRARSMWIVDAISDAWSLLLRRPLYVRCFERWSSQPCRAPATHAAGEESYFKSGLPMPTACAVHATDRNVRVGPWRRAPVWSTLSERTKRLSPAETEDA